MRTERGQEALVETKVNYMLELDGKFVIVENVPARVCLETGERFFSPETVERIQKIFWEKRKPNRVVEASVFEFP
ncbi:MAG: type II toxin-antitoxin system MqsA family antitoxin [Hormoscilla sp. GM7CHS1pb]|nr:type II toxin-antitoxin system MqsA family antitoxin [Hormoscilla sp. GM7CHS1pb]